MSAILPVIFAAGTAGGWRIERMAPVIGDSLPAAQRLQMVEGGAAIAGAPAWQLRGIVSNIRYSTTTELKQLAFVSPPLGRPEATAAALIPIKKSSAWWSLGQDERRAIFEERSHHIARSIEHLPAVFRRLHHARDLGEPFDFLTWFEYAPQYRELFEQLVRELRTSEEWRYVEREVDIRLSRDQG